MLYVPAAILALAAVFDLRDREIPNFFAVLLALFALVQWAVGLAPATWPWLLAGLGLGLSIFLLLAFVGGFGGGDAKLLVAIGPVLGLALYLKFLFAMAIAGGLLSVIALLRRRQDLAYGPAIAIGMLAVALWHSYGR